MERKSIQKRYVKRNVQTMKIAKFLKETPEGGNDEGDAPGRGNATATGDPRQGERCGRGGASEGARQRQWRHRRRHFPSGLGSAARASSCDGVVRGHRRRRDAGGGGADEDAFSNAVPIERNGTNRFATVFLYLNDAAKGGETVFPKGRAVDDGVNAVRMLCKDPRMLAGGGACE